MGRQIRERERKGQDWSLYNGGIDEYSPQPNRQWLSLIFKNMSLLASGGLIMAGLILLVGLWRGGSQFLAGLRSTFTVLEPPAKVDVRSMVVQQIRGASELTTAIYTMESVVPASRERMLGGYVIGKTTLLYIAHGEVRAGVDLTTLRPEDVQVNGTALALRLPPPQVLDSKIDVNRSKVYDYDRGFMGLGPDVAPELQELAQRETLAKIVETACSDGVLQSANDRAKTAVTQLLTTAGYTQLTVETQPPTPENCVVPSPAPVSPLPSAGLESPLPSGSLPGPLPASPLPLPVEPVEPVEPAPSPPTL